MKTKEQKLALLKETSELYNSKNRSTKNGRCLYFCETAAGQGCAVGRLIPDKKFCQWLDNIHCGPFSSSVGALWDKIPCDIQEWGKLFLTELQRLHDNADFWDENGLSQKGLEKYSLIQEEMNIGKL